MNPFDFLITPALLGLVAGIAHGIVSHRADLPLSLTEQVQHVVEHRDTAWQ